MKKTAIWALLALCGCATSSGAMGRQGDSLVGSWRGVLVKGLVRSPVNFEFAGGGGAYTGTWWSPPALESVALANVHLASPPLASSGALGGVQLGSTIHFEIPRQAVFEGNVRGDVVEGTFRDQDGAGTFRLEKEPEMRNDVRYTP